MVLSPKKEQRMRYKSSSRINLIGAGIISPVKLSDARRSPGWIVLIATLSGIIWGATTFVGHAESSTIYINNCGIIDYQPDVIFQACADGNIGVGDVVWDKWSKDGATGEGIFTVNTCEPDCATGEYLKSRCNHSDRI